MRAFFTRLKQGTERLTYGRSIVAAWAASRLSASARASLTVLDLGCGAGDDLVNVRRAVAAQREVRLLGIEASPEAARGAARRGIEVTRLDIERTVYPFEDATIDCIIANQIIEHTKEIFWIFSECSRLLVPGGYLVVGVPNLAALHNRVLLLAGEQPSSIEPLGPHVRGFTRRGFQRFVEADGVFRIEEVRGANFYPFPPPLSTILARLAPGLAVGLLFLVRKVDPVRSFGTVLRSRTFETSFFPGPQDIDG
jgi:SAM-dependent methyltransferase